MLFFKLIWLCTGFGESWNFSFKQKHWVALAAGTTTHQTTTEWWGSKRDPLLPRTRSDSLGNIYLTADNALQKILFSNLALNSGKCWFFQAANWADTMCFPLFKRNWEGESSVWPHWLSSTQRLPTLKEHAKHKHLCFSSLNAAAPVTLLIPPHKQLTEKAGFPQNTSEKRAEAVVIHSISQAKSSQGETWQ